MKDKSLLFFNKTPAAPPWRWCWPRRKYQEEQSSYYSSRVLFSSIPHSVQVLEPLVRCDLQFYLHRYCVWNIMSIIASKREEEETLFAPHVSAAVMHFERYCCHVFAMLRMESFWWLLSVDIVAIFRAVACCVSKAHRSMRAKDFDLVSPMDERLSLETMHSME